MELAFTDRFGAPLIIAGVTALGYLAWRERMPRAELTITVCPDVPIRSNVYGDHIRYKVKNVGAKASEIDTYTTLFGVRDGNPIDNERMHFRTPLLEPGEEHAMVVSFAPPSIFGSTREFVAQIQAYPVGRPELGEVKVCRYTVWQ